MIPEYRRIMNLDRHVGSSIEDSEQNTYSQVAGVRHSRLSVLRYSDTSSGSKERLGGGQACLSRAEKDLTY